MKRSLLLASLSLASVTFAPRLYAQEVSAADKDAARQLFVEGDALQKQNRCAEAIDKFERSVRVYRAPTTLLRIAQCQAALGHLVEADEMYREGARFELRADASSAFQAAKTQAATEGAALAPRVPALRVDVVPPGIRGLVVTVDDQPLNEALIGVARPLNPGTHKVTATAAGYSRAEQLVQVKERQKDASVQLQLVPQSGPPSVPTPVGPGPAPIPVGPQPLPQQGQPQGQGAGQQPDPNVYVQQPKKVSETSFFYGLRLGYEATLSSNDNPYAGWGFGGELAVRFVKYMTLSTALDIGRVSFTGDSSSTSLSQYRTFVRAAAYVGYISAADAPVGVWAQLGGAARYEATDATSDAKSGGGTSISLSVGVPIKVSTVRIVPRLDLDPAHDVAFVGVSGLIEVGGRK